MNEQESKTTEVAPVAIPLEADVAQMLEQLLGECSTLVHGENPDGRRQAFQIVKSLGQTYARLALLLGIPAYAGLWFPRSCGAELGIEDTFEPLPETEDQLPVLEVWHHNYSQVARAPAEAVSFAVAQSDSLRRLATTLEAHVD